MLNRDSHPPDAKLLRFSDGELAKRRAARIGAHVAICEHCRGRMEAMRATMEEFGVAHRKRFDPWIAAMGPGQAQLRALWAESGAATPKLSFNPRRWIFAGGAALILALCAVVAWRAPKGPNPAVLVDEGLLPNPNLTPGVAQPVSLTAICAMKHEVTDLPVSGALSEAVFREYRIQTSAAANYEVDLLITPGLGGTENIRNLWPEPRYHTAWNSYVKDQLEEYLHESVCAGTVALPTAQTAIADNWIAAYRQYFRTKQPLPTLGLDREMGALLPHILR